ncbi:alanyl-tRNA synthetase [Pancytospora epiphaga]|nr:alanyl-tRNA synthetase [Pancytospora epiphaga]
MAWTSEQLRRRFTEFFEKNNHKVLPSSSVLPQNDKTLLFTNSGMVQFKDIFLGEKSKYSRVCTVQRCIRAGGKHNDLDDVGKDNYHHTFFEMLGNWSFGDYFKEEAIRYAYEFLVEDLGLDKERLYVTVYDDMDTESRRIWRQYLDETRILGASAKDNFWEMGEYGPCGPCTEIHYDRVGGRDASALVNMDDQSVIEIWNIVFMEFNKTPSGLEPLKIKHIDTGIGFERLLSILMGVSSNYQIDSFKSIIKLIEEKCNHVFEDESSLIDTAFRVIADHSRTMAVCINDGVIFSSDGVGYVLRRILRRAVRYSHNILGLSQGVLAQIVAFAADTQGISIDVSVVDAEELLFLKTLKSGSVRFNKIVNNNGRLEAADVFLLYDTYGFPKDLTELMAREKGIPISLEGFDELRAKAQDVSKTTRTTITVQFDCEKTSDEYKYSENGVTAKLLAVVRDNEKILPEDATEGEGLLFLLFDKTCFYAEKGGQVGDRGVIEFYDEDGKAVGKFEVVDTQGMRGYVLHIGTLKGSISKTAKLTYDENLRALTRANHSTCHILYHFLGTFFKTAQRGSLVDSEKCRFDFDGNKLSTEVLVSLEYKMNEFIKSNACQSTRIISYEEAIENPSLQLEDGDYSNGVRIVSFSNGTEVVDDPCGGTHVKDTGEIELVRIISETGTKANIRRIVVVSRERAHEADENAKRLREELGAGDVVTTDCLLSTVERAFIEDWNKKNIKAAQKKVTEKIKEVTEKLKESIANFRVKNLMKDDIFIFKENNVDFLKKKDLTRLLSVIGNELCASKVIGICSIERESETYLSAVARNNGKLLDALNNGAEDNAFKILNGYVQGVGKGNDFRIHVNDTSNKAIFNSE